MVNQMYIIEFTAYYLANISVVLEKLNALTIEDLIKLIMKNLTNTVDKDPHKMDKIH